MKMFTIIGIICFAETADNMKCLNYFEDPIKYYKSKTSCDISAEKLGYKIDLEFEKQNIRVYEHISWCMPEWRDPTA